MKTRFANLLSMHASFHVSCRRLYCIVYGRKAEKQQRRLRLKGFELKKWKSCLLMKRRNERSFSLN